jgi:molybdopterin-guanine dinucleotide biosynthesis protein A
MIEHVVRQLAEVVDEIVVVTSETLALPELPARVVQDRESERGPLAGIRDGLAAVESEFAFVTGTDAPFLSAPFVSRMLAIGKPCAPKSDGHIQVLCAVYPSAGWKEADRLLEKGSGRPLHLLEALGYEAIDFGLDDSSPPWRGFNTPEAYLAGVRELDPSATVEIELSGHAARENEVTKRSAPVGTLGEILSAWPASAGLVTAGSVASPFVVSIGGRDLVRDLSVPIGPGESVRVIDAPLVGTQGSGL